MRLSHAVSQLLDSTAIDLRQAVRALRRFAVANAALVTLLAIGIGSIGTVLTLVDRLLLAPLPVPDPDALVLLRRTTDAGSRSDGFSLPMVQALSDGSRSLSAVAAFDNTRLELRMGGTSESVAGRLLSGSGFALLGVNPWIGRSLGTEDDRPGRPAVVMVSFPYWQRRFAGDPAVVGASVTLNGTPATIVGVLPPGFTGLAVGEAPEALWLPMSLHPALALEDHKEVGVIGRLANGVTSARAATELTAIQRAARAAGVDRDTVRRDANRAAIEVVSARQGIAELPKMLSSTLVLLLAAAVLLVLVICGNAAGLLAARARARAHETAVRLAIGVSRARLLRQLIVENSLITGVGALIGILAAWWATPVLLHFLVMDAATPMIDAMPSVGVLAVLATVAMAAAIGFASMQAVIAGRADVSQMLRTSRGHSGGRSAARMGRAVVAGQLALSLLLVLDALLVADAVRRVATVDPGFDREHVMMFWTFARTRGYSGDREHELYRTLTERIATLPDVRASSIVRYRPGLPRKGTCAASQTPGMAPPDVFVNAVGPGYFSTIGMRIVAGRELNSTDRGAMPRVAIVGQRVATALFGRESAIGRRMLLPGLTSDGVEIVGVVADALQYHMRPGLATTRGCDVYVPVSQAPASYLGQMNVVIRAAGDPLPLVPALRRAVESVDANLTLGAPTTTASLVRGYYGRQEALSRFALAFSLLAIAVAAVGLYGTLALGVASRVRELGIRAALGATRGDAVRLIVVDAARVLLAGAVVGLAAAAASTRLLGATVLGLEAVRAVPALAAVVVILWSGLLAAYLPARRAARVDPARVLRD